MSSPFDSSYEPKPLENWAKTAPFTTIPQLFRCSVKKNGHLKFLGAKVDGHYQYQTYREVQNQVHEFGCALLALGLDEQDRVAQISQNRPEWVVTDLGCLHVNCVHVPLYPTLSEEAIQYILQDSGARIAVASTAEHLQAVLAVAGQCKALEHIISMSGKGDAKAKKTKLWDWGEFLAYGKDNLDKQSENLESRLAKMKPTDVCSLVYTSGTTGEPKGAMLMQGNFVSNSTSVLPLVEVRPGDIQLSFLPLSHVFERCVYYTMLCSGVTIAYAESIETVREDLKVVQPHLVPSVPRLFEKIHAGVLQKVHKGLNMQRRAFYWALGIGEKVFELRRQGRKPGPFLAARQKLASKIVAKIHEATGGRIRLFVSGGAPLRKDVGEFFLHAGFNLVEGYGLTETSPVITMNPPARPKMGTVGEPLQSVEVRIADDGEILTRGPHVMRGYFNKPEATRKAINEDGWFHTGDIGEFDSDNYLRITDRKKEILVMSNGKNVAPSPIEQAIKSSKYIEQAVLIGDNRKFISALVVPAFEAIQEWCKENSVPSKPEELVLNDKVRDFLLEECASACEEFSRYEQVKKIALLEAELTQETGELTPTLKVKRRIVNEKFKDRIESLYSDN